MSLSFIYSTLCLLLITFCATRTIARVDIREVMSKVSVSKERMYSEIWVALEKT